MKKIVMFVLVVAMMIGCVAFASEIDFSNYTFDELNEIQSELTMAMWNTNEWQEVEVPVGSYMIGEDIPAGKWNIKGSRCGSYCYVCEDLDETGLSYGKGDWDSIYISDGESININLTEGKYFIVHTGDSVIFTPATKPTLGFKK